VNLTPLVLAAVVQAQPAAPLTVASPDGKNVPVTSASRPTLRLAPGGGVAVRIRPAS
jgi:hypothetical protein